MSGHAGNPAPGVGGTAKDGGLSTAAVRSHFALNRGDDRRSHETAVDLLPVADYHRLDGCGRWRTRQCP